MRIAGPVELPTDRQDDYRRAKLYAWITLGFLATAIVALYLTLGSSQAMKAAWIEDLASLVPPIGFLVASRYIHRSPTEDHPYGFHRAVSIAYLFSSVVLVGLGTFILYESALTLVNQEHPTIGSVTLLGHTFWMGWLMIGVLAYTIVPAVLLGRAQLPLAERLHDKSLYAIAKMLKADWGTATAGIAGILGIGLGIWWADAVAAILISADIIKDGWTNTRIAIRELSDGVPKLVDGSAVDPLQSRLQTEMEKLEWVERAFVRIRDEGHVFFGDAIVVPNRDVTPAELESTAENLLSLDWRLYEFIITPMVQIDVGFVEATK